MNKERTMKKLKETGITLVALVVTIIILLILAGVTLNLALGEGGILARAKNMADQYQSMQANELGQLIELEKKLDKYGNYTGRENIEEQASDLKDKLKGDGSVMGKTVTGLTGGVSENYTWEIFYADENNIYLVTTDYIQITDCPKKDSEALLLGDTDYEGYWSTTLLDKYSTGSTSITHEAIKKLNNDFFNVKGYISTDDNMKAVAYMLDTDIWKEKIIGADEKNIVQYVIGGPTIELLFDAYNAKNGTKFGAKAYEENSTKGYKISKDNTKNENESDWQDWIDSMIPTTDKTFIFTDKTKAPAYWVASPSTFETNYIMDVLYNGIVGRGHCMASYQANGFRPVVCLNKGVILEKNGDGYKIKKD